MAPTWPLEGHGHAAGRPAALPRGAAAALEPRGGGAGHHCLRPRAAAARARVQQRRWGRCDDERSQEAGVLWESFLFFPPTRTALFPRSNPSFLTSQWAPSHRCGSEIGTFFDLFMGDKLSPARASAVIFFMD